MSQLRKRRKLRKQRLLQKSQKLLLRSQLLPKSQLPLMMLVSHLNLIHLPVQKRSKFMTIVNSATKELVKQAMILGYINSLMKLCHQLTDGEVEERKVQSMDGIHLTSIQTHQLMVHMDLIPSTHHLVLLNIATITIKPEILVMKVLLRKFTVSLTTTRVSSHNHGEEQRKLIHKTDSRTHHSNGSTRRAKEAYP